MTEPKSEVFQMDCLEGMKAIPDKSVDLLLTDPPYGVTQNPWDIAVDFVALWEQLNRIVKPNGAFIFTSTQPFATDLINSNRDKFRYDLIWEKSIATGFLNANRMPLRGHEIVCVFYRGLPTYNPQKYKLDQRPSFKKGNKGRGSSNYGKFTHEMDIGSKDGTRFPRSVFTVDYENSFFDSSFETVQKMIHPTQKPVSLFEYLIKTYSNEGDIVLDPFMGSGTSRIAAWNSNRGYIGFEWLKGYFEDSVQRFEDFKKQLKLF